MENKLLKLEKMFFKKEYISNKKWLNEILDENYIEIGKSGKRFDKETTINELIALNIDRDIIIYNFVYNKITENIYLVHYITKNNNDNIYRTSLWSKEKDKMKLIFHQATLFKENVHLIEY